VLHRRRVERSTDAFEHRFALLAILVEYADLDEFVGKQVHVDLMQYRGGQTMMTDNDDRMQVVRLRAQLAAVGGSDCRHGDILPWPIGLELRCG